MDMGSLFDDGDERLRQICGPKISLLQGCRAAQVWPLSLTDVYQLVGGDFDLAAAMHKTICLEGRLQNLLSLVRTKETGDPQMIRWIEERLEFVPEGHLQDTLRFLLEQLRAKPTEKTKPDNRRMDADMKAAMDSLKRKYEGRAHEILYGELTKLSAESHENIHYSCYTSIVQSSGTGKTRAVMEMSRLGVYVCYCSTAEPGSSACPPRTPLLADLLCQIMSEVDMVLYFKAWLRVLADKVGADTSEVTVGAVQKEESAVKWMTEQMDGSDVITRMVHATWIEYKSKVHQMIEAAGDLDERNVALLKNEMVKLETVLGPVDKVDILFVFDEGRGLLPTETTTFSEAESPFYQMRRGARAFFRNKRCFAVVMDTMGIVSNMQPKRNDGKSRKVKQMGYHLHRPLYQLDTMRLATRTSDLTPERMFRYGRPLWSSRLDKGTIGSLLVFAETKLVGVVLGNLRGENVDVYGYKGKVKLSVSQALALLSASVGLEICAQSIQSQLLVASHMSILNYVSNDRSRVYIGHPVEPVLGEAAARILSRGKGKVLVEALSCLQHSFMNGYVGAGDRGETVVKILLLLACWRLVDDRMFYLRRIPIRDYLKSLLGWTPEDLEEACDELPEESYVFFNSFMLVDEKIELSAGLLAAAYMRGCGIHFKAGNRVKGFDFAIPISTPQGMTCLLVSGKCVRKRGSLRKEATLLLTPAALDVVWSNHAIKVLTLLVNVQEPKVQTPPLTSKLWRKGDLAKSYPSCQPIPVAHMSLYGLENYLFGKKRDMELSDEEREVKKLLMQISMSAPDVETLVEKEFPEAKEFLGMLMPDRYQLQLPTPEDQQKLNARDHVKKSNDAGLLTPVPVPATEQQPVASASVSRGAEEIVGDYKARAHRKGLKLMVIVSENTYQSATERVKDTPVFNDLGAFLFCQVSLASEEGKVLKEHFQFSERGGFIEYNNRLQVMKVVHAPLQLDDLVKHSFELCDTGERKRSRFLCVGGMR